MKHDISFKFVMQDTSREAVKKINQIMNHIINNQKWSRTLFLPIVRTLIFTNKATVEEYRNMWSGRGVKRRISQHLQGDTLKPLK